MDFLKSYLSIYLSIYFWIFIAEGVLSLVTESWGYSLVVVRGLPVAAASLVSEHRLQCP